MRVFHLLVVRFVACIVLHYHGLTRLTQEIRKDVFTNGNCGDIYGPPSLRCEDQGLVERPMEAGLRGRSPSCSGIGVLDMAYLFSSFRNAKHNQVKLYTTIDGICKCYTMTIVKRRRANS